jgi:anti-sigma B factor antagonist
MRRDGSGSSRRHGDSWVMELAGEHDLSTAPMLTEWMAEIDASARLIEVDLRQAEFIDSTVLGALVRLGADLAADGRELVIVAPTGTPPRRVLDLAGMSAVLRILETSPSGGVETGSWETSSCP